MQNDEKKVKKSFLKGMKTELKKVIWPTGKQTAKSTAATIGFVLLISVILIVLNIFFKKIKKKWYDLILDRDSSDIDSSIVSGDLDDTLSGEEVDGLISGETSGDNDLENSGESAVQ